MTSFILQNQPGFIIADLTISSVLKPQQLIRSYIVKMQQERTKSTMVYS